MGIPFFCSEIIIVIKNNIKRIKFCLTPSVNNINKLSFSIPVFFKLACIFSKFLYKVSCLTSETFIIVLDIIFVVIIVTLY